jgi:PAS domain S-box-containing protein
VAAEKLFKQNTAAVLDLKSETDNYSATNNHIVLLNVDIKVKNLLFKQNNEKLDFEEVNNTEQLFQKLKQQKNTIDALILGLEHKEPVRISQRIHSMDKNIPLLILTEPNRHEQLKHVLKFSPFLGNDVLTLATDSLEQLTNTISEMVERAQKRRAYRGTIAAAQKRMGNAHPDRPRVRQYLDRLLDHAPIGVLNINIQGSILALNRRASQILKLPEREALGNSLIDIFPSSEQVALHNIIAKCVAPSTQRSPEVFDISETVGSIRHIEVIASSLVDRSGQLGATVIIQDITDRVQAELERSKAEKALRISERRYRELVQTMSEALALIDKEHRITYVNDSFCTMFGYDSNDVLGRNLLDFVHESDKEMMKENISNPVESDKVQRYETAWLTKNNEKFYTLTSPKRIFDPEKGYIGCLGVFTDITEHKKSEEHDKKQMMELAHVSRVTTIGEMSSQIAHELAQPLTAIAGLSTGCEKMIKSKTANQDEILEAIVYISEQAKRAREIVVRLRNFVRNEEIKQTQIDMNKLVKNVVHLVEVEARWHNIPVKLELHKPLPFILGDRLLIEQVILNLVHNAVEAMQQIDQLNRNLKIRTSMPEADLIKVEIKDSGPGIDENNLNKIFEPFFTTKADGMGMGLAITRSIIDAHGTQLIAERNKQGGTTFCFTLKTHDFEEMSHVN